MDNGLVFIFVSKGGIVIQEEQFTSNQGTNTVKIGKNIIGQPFPEITSKSLAGDVISLPKIAEGKATFICIAFVRSAQSMIDSWTELFELEFGKDSRFIIYEVPMINAAWNLDSRCLVTSSVILHDIFFKVSNSFRLQER